MNCEWCDAERGSGDVIVVINVGDASSMSFYCDWDCLISDCVAMSMGETDRGGKN